jgi:hypothetical protein
MSLVESTVSRWVAHEQLSRLVAGLFPRFMDTSDKAKFDAIIRRAGNTWSSSVLDFHRQLAAGTVGYESIRKFVVAGNPSMPNRITHSKFLVLLSLLKNPDLTPTAVGYLKKMHAWALTDHYYSTMI